TRACFDPTPSVRRMVWDMYINYCLHPHYHQASKVTSTDLSPLLRSSSSSSLAWPSIQTQDCCNPVGDSRIQILRDVHKMGDSWCRDGRRGGLQVAVTVLMVAAVLLVAFPSTNATGDCYKRCCKDTPKHKLEKPYCDKHDNEYKDYCHAKCEFKHKDWKEEPRECRRRRDDHDRHDRHDHDDRHDRHDDDGKR
ncbi:hypothetical protein Vafri_16136, partial [Volvox africanus]